MKNNLDTLKLFNAILVPEYKKGQLELLEKTVPLGFILDSSVSANANDELIREIGAYYLSTSKANQSFHKSWQTVKDTPQEILWLQAIIHYFTTYGYEELGIEGEIYIPEEKLDIPGGITLIRVIGITEGDLKERIVKLGDGIALAENTIKSIVAIIEGGNYKIDVEKIKNRELKSALYDLYNIVPKEPTEYLRFILSKLTGETLLIKSENFIEKIKESKSQLQRRELDRLLREAPRNLAEIFFRYKPIFLALKSISADKTFFNRLRKDADTKHKPLPPDYLNNITGNIKRGDNLDLNKLREKLDETIIFRKIRLANALRYRLSSPQSIVYKIRNGRSWVEDFVAKNQDKTKEILDVVMESLKIDKRVYVPEFIDYGLPATEKQFIGHLPSNTKISVDDNLIVGVYWENVEQHRIDLDFSSIGLINKIGWDSVYKSNDNSVLFSGDMTDARGGASELFYFGENNQSAYALFLNYFNYDKSVPVSAKIFVAHENPKNFRKNYVANNIIVQSDFIIKERQYFVGLVYGNSLYLSTASIGKSISSGGDLARKTRMYLINSINSSLRLADVLDVVHERGDYPDLSPEKLDKSTILDLIT